MDERWKESYEIGMREGGRKGGREGRRDVPALESIEPPGLICVKVTSRVLLGSEGWGRIMFPARRISERTYLRKGGREGGEG